MKGTMVRVTMEWSRLRRYLQEVTGRVWMKNLIAITVLFTALAAVILLSPEPLLYARSDSESGQGDAAVSGISSVAHLVKDAASDMYQSASKSAQKTGEGIAEVAVGAREAVAGSQDPGSVEAVKSATTAAVEEEEDRYWQKAEEKLNEANEAVREGAALVKNALLCRSNKGEERSGSYAHQAAESVRGAGEKLRLHAEAIYATLQDSVGKAREMVAGSAHKAAEGIEKTVSSAQDVASRWAQSALDTSSRTAGAASEKVGDAYSSAKHTTGHAAELVYDAAKVACDIASQGADTAYDAVNSAVHKLADKTKAIPDKAVEYAGSARDRLGYFGSSDASSNVGQKIKQVPTAAKETVEDVVERLKNILKQQSAKDGGEQLEDEWGFEAVKENLAAGKSEKQKWEALYEFMTRLPRQGNEEMEGLLEWVKETLAGLKTREQRSPRDEKKGFWSGLRDMLPGHSTDVPNDKDKHREEDWTEKVSEYFSYRGQTGKGPTLEEMSKRLLRCDKDERGGILAGLRQTLEGYTGEEKKRHFDAFKSKLALHSGEDGKGVLEELKEVFTGTADSGYRSGLDQVKDKLGLCRKESAEDAVTALSGEGKKESTAAIGGGHQEEEEGSFYEYVKYEYLKQNVEHSGADKSHRDAAKGGTSAHASADSSKEHGQKLGEQNGLGEQAKNNGSVGMHGTVADAARKIYGRLSHVPEQLGEHMGLKNLIPEEFCSGGHDELYRWKKEGGAMCECSCWKDTASGSCRDVGITVGRKVADLGHGLKERAASARSKMREKAESVASTIISFGGSSTQKEHARMVQEVSSGPRAGGLITSLSRLLHLAAFSFTFGTSVWMTFVSGQVLSRSVGTEQFVYGQSCLFSAYLKLTAIAQAILFVMHLLQHTRFSSHLSEKLQFLNLCFLLSATFINILYLEPRVSGLMLKKLKVEKGEAGARNKCNEDGELAKLHGFSSWVNLISLVGQIWHMWYLARRLVI